MTPRQALIAARELFKVHNELSEMSFSLDFLKLFDRAIEACLSPDGDRKRQTGLTCTGER